jgi:hypothetical protein
MPPALGFIFTIDVDGKPTVAFEAQRFREAAELCAEQWLRDDLSALTSGGVPLYRVGSKLRARKSNETEMEIYREAVRAPETVDDILLAYLIEVDGNELRAKGK